MAQSVAMAREIIAQGHKHGAWEGDPAALSDEQALTDSAELVQLARNAYDGDIRSDAVLEILFAAQIEPPAEQPEMYADVYERHGATSPTAGSGTQAESAPAADPDSEPDRQPAPAGEPAPEGDIDGAQVDINSIVPGYDDRKAADLKKVILAAAESGDLTEDEFAQIVAYEQTNEERSGILKLQPTFKPKPAPESEPPARDTVSAAKPGDYGDNGALESAYKDGSLGSDRARQEGLAEPASLVGSDGPQLPVDITSISDQELSRLAMQYHSLHARTARLISQEEGRATAAEHLRDEYEREAYGRAYGALKEKLDKETAAALEAARSEAKHESSNDETVRMWRTRAVRHRIEARELKSYDVGYEDAEARLSREQSRREKLAQS